MKQGAKCKKGSNANGTLAAFFGMGLWLSLFLSMPLAAAKPMTVQAVDTDVRALLLSVARAGGIPLVIGGDVTGQVTVNLTEEPMAVLRAVAQTDGLAFVQKENGTVWITSASGSGLYDAHVWKVRYADPQELADAVNLYWSAAGNHQKTSNKSKDSGNQQASLPARQKASLPTERTRNEAQNGGVFVDATGGSLVYFGTPRDASRIGAMIEKLDVPPRQVSLEAKVVALTKDGSKSIGVEWDSGVQADTITMRRVAAGGPFRGDSEIRLHELVSDGRARILSRPNITTLQGREAFIKIGGDVPIAKTRTTNRETTQSYDYRPVGIILQCTPRINADGTITTRVHTEISTPEYVNDLKTYRFQDRQADTNVRLRDGETMVIGGLIGQEEARHMSGIPLLSRLPVLGGFFRYLKSSRQDAELMIFLTAHAIDSHDAAS
ncbi:MAG: pilus assembly protein PilQ [Selenomonadaceae bacterium]|nr:pilus assembly protein PilQ [Selenomonadaceae bacterium]MDY2684982.1 pilus assembly protein PilQ [Selenomonadaceae bacterium]